MTAPLLWAAFEWGKVESTVRAGTGGGLVAMRSALYLADLAGRRGDDISSLITAGKVICNVDADTKLQFRAELQEPVDFQPYVDCLIPELTLRYADGTVVTEQVGLYVVAPPPKTHRSWGTTIKPDGRDLTWLLRRSGFGDGYSVAAGTEYTAAVATIIASVSLSLRYAIPSSGKTVPVARSWPPGTTKLEVVNDLLAGVAYYSLYADRQGVITSRPIVPLDAVEPTATYTSGNGSQIVGDIDDEPDLTRQCNVVTVRKITPDQAPLYATRKNQNAASPIGIPTIGVELTRPDHPIDVPDLVDQAAANALADAYLAEGASYYRRLTLRTTPDPTAGVHDVVSLSVSNKDGEAVTGLWWRLGWELGFRPSDGVMTHKLSRVEPYR